MFKFVQRQRERHMEERVQRLGSELVNLRWEVLDLDLEQTLGAIDACMSTYLRETIGSRQGAGASKAIRPKEAVSPRVERRKPATTTVTLQTPRIQAC
jgi:hypothetical protein